LRLKGGRIGNYGEWGGADVPCKRRSDLLSGILLDSENKWGLKEGNG